jgi:hypothetical protein
VPGQGEAACWGEVPRLGQGPTAAPLRPGKSWVAPLPCDASHARLLVSQHSAASVRTARRHTRRQRGRQGSATRDLAQLKECNGQANTHRRGDGQAAHAADTGSATVGVGGERSVSEGAAAWRNGGERRRTTLLRHPSRRVRRNVLHTRARSVRQTHAVTLTSGHESSSPPLCTRKRVLGGAHAPGSERLARRASRGEASHGGRDNVHGKGLHPGNGGAGASVGLPRGSDGRNWRSTG